MEQIGYYICELGYCPYAEPYAVEAYDIVCEDCIYWVPVDDTEDGVLHERAGSI